jgi:hypothetical protein
LAELLQLLPKGAVIGRLEFAGSSMDAATVAAINDSWRGDLLVSIEIVIDDNLPAALRAARAASDAASDCQFEPRLYVEVEPRLQAPGTARPVFDLVVAAYPSLLLRRHI